MLYGAPPPVVRWSPRRNTHPPAWVQVWDASCTHLLYVWSLPPDAHGASSSGGSGSSAATDSCVPFSRGAAINVTNDGAVNICFGTSAGLVYALEVRWMGWKEEAGREVRVLAFSPSCGCQLSTRGSACIGAEQRVWGLALHACMCSSAKRIGNCSGLANACMRGWALLQVSGGGGGPNASPSFKSPTAFKAHSCPVTAVSSPYQSRRGTWTRDLGCQLVSGDEDGGITVWEGRSSRDYAVLHSIPSTGMPAVSLAVRGDMVVAGRLDGAVQIYGLVRGAWGRHVPRMHACMWARAAHIRRARVPWQR